VSVIVPTRNEQGNVEELATRIACALDEYSKWQLVFVDDSDDDTPRRIQSLQMSLPIELVHRQSTERSGGLGGAVLDGFAVASGDILVVMDGDLQHPPELAATLAAAVELRLADVVIASRFVPGATASGLSGRTRRLVTCVTRRAAHLAVPRSRGVRDPLSGFFAIKADVVSTTEMRSQGFKILLDVLAQGWWSTALEVPFAFGRRQSGSSKAGLREGLRFARQLLRSRVHEVASSTGFHTHSVYRPHRGIVKQDSSLGSEFDCQLSSATSASTLLLDVIRPSERSGVEHS